MHFRVQLLHNNLVILSHDHTGYQVIAAIIMTSNKQAMLPNGSVPGDLDVRCDRRRFDGNDDEIFASQPDARTWICRSKSQLQLDGNDWANGYRPAGSIEGDRLKCRMSQTGIVGSKFGF